MKLFSGERWTNRANHQQSLPIRSIPDVALRDWVMMTCTWVCSSQAPETARMPDVPRCGPP